MPRVKSNTPAKMNGKYCSWAEIIAKDKSRIRAVGRKVVGGERSYALKGSDVFYKPHFGVENAGLSFQNTYYWDILG